MEQKLTLKFHHSSINGCLELVTIKDCIIAVFFLFENQQCIFLVPFKNTIYVQNNDNSIKIKKRKGSVIPKHYAFLPVFIIISSEKWSDFYPAEKMQVHYTKFCVLLFLLNL